MFLCPWFVLFCLGRTSETTARILLENWVTGLGETTASIPYYITVYHVGLIFSHQILSLCVSRVSFKCQCVYGLYSFAWTEQVRPLHASYLTTGSLAEVRPLHAPLVISLRALLGWFILIRSCLWVSIWSSKGSMCLWFVQFWWRHKWDHCTHLTWNMGHRMKWDHYKHPLSYHFVLCWGDLFSSHHFCWYQYALLKGQCIYGLCCFVWAEQVRPLHTPYLKSGSQGEVRPLQAPLVISLCAFLGVIFSHQIISVGINMSSYRFSVSMVCTVLPGQNKWDHCISYLKTRSLAVMRPLHAYLVISLCALLGWSILIRSCLWVSICAPKGSVFLWFVQFSWGWSENTAHTLLEIWVTGWSETTTSTPYHITHLFCPGKTVQTEDTLTLYELILIPTDII